MLLRQSMLIATVCLLSGCASIVNGQHQNVSINSAPETGAQCQLTNDAGTWFIAATPASVMISRSGSDLTVICKKDNISGTAIAASYTKAMAFGNILFGGIIGAAVDASNGAAFDYPALINVEMAKGGHVTKLLPPPSAKQDSKKFN